MLGIIPSLFAQDLYQDIDKGTVPKDIARAIDESWVLMKSEKNSEARGALAISMLPIFQKYYVNSRAHLITLMQAADYYYATRDYQSAADYIDELFERMDENHISFQKFGFPETLQAYSLFARISESRYDYKGALIGNIDGLSLSHMMGDSLKYRALEFSTQLAGLYGYPWSPIRDESKYKQYKDSCRYYLSIQNLSIPNMLQYVTTNASLLSAVCSVRGDYEEAIRIMSPYMDRFNTSTATVEDLGIVEGWVYNCSRSGRNAQAQKFTPLALRLVKEDMIDYYSIFNEGERQSNSNNYDSFFSAILSSATHSDFGPVLGDIYNYILFRKNILLRTSLNITDALEKVTDKKVRFYWADYQFSRLKLDYEKQSRKPNKNLVDSLTKRVDMLDRMLTYYAYQNRIDDPAPTWKDIQKRLSEHAIAVEYYKYDHVIGNKWQDELYVAFVITKRCKHPYMVQLFSRDDLPDRAFGTGYQQKVFGNLEKFLHLGDTIYFSAHGSLHSMSMETMPLPDNTWTSDRYVPIRLTSTAHLVKPQKSYDRSAILYGGLSYNLTPKTMRTEAMLASRTRAGVDPLPYTKTEIENIGKNLKQRGYKVTLLSGSKGNEESFKALSGHSPAIIHLATHGFYKDTYDNDERDPMLRTGLLLSGANAKALMTGRENYDDGVLTAHEISRLDLRGTELVVLSACETGMGDITPDGVWGLQRAFKIAGAETLILSLWEIAEEPTEQFMSIFYNEYLRDHNKIRAFRKAQDAIRQAYPEDFHWAAFIMLD